MVVNPWKVCPTKASDRLPITHGVSLGSTDRYTMLPKRHTGTLLSVYSNEKQVPSVMRSTDQCDCYHDVLGAGPTRVFTGGHFTRWQSPARDPASRNRRFKSLLFDKYSTCK
jgi:hypothetical protein